MKYQFEVPANDRAVADSPEIGGESQVKISYEDFVTLGKISQPSEDSGEYTPHAGLSIPAGGADIALRCNTAIKSSSSVQITLNVTFDDDNSGTVSAQYQIPTTAYDQTSNLPIGLMVDFDGSGGNETKKVKAITGIQSFTGGQANNVFEVMILPNTWHDLGCARNKDETLPIPAGLPIPCGLNSSAYTKFGRGEAGSLTLEALAFTYADGLSRLNGHRVAIMVEVMKEGRVLSERSVYGGWRAAVNTPRGDGDDEVVSSAEGVFETFGKFV